MIYLVVEPDVVVVDTIKDCLKLARKLDVGITTTVNGVQLYMDSYDTSNSVYVEYLDAIREQGGVK